MHVLFVLHNGLWLPYKILVCTHTHVPLDGSVGDRPLQASAQIKINVIDVNDIPPQLSTVNGCINVSEASPAGSLVWTATIANGVTDAVFFTIANQAEQ